MKGSTIKPLSLAVLSLRSELLANEGVGVNGVDVGGGACGSTC